MRLDERNLIPIRLVTLEDNVLLKKGISIGTLSVMECDESNKSMNIRGMVEDNDRRWEVLEPKFRNKLKDMPRIQQQQQVLPILK